MLGVQEQLGTHCTAASCPPSPLVTLWLLSHHAACDCARAEMAPASGFFHMPVFRV
jgi:hypothetical protein